MAGPRRRRQEQAQEGGDWRSGGADDVHLQLLCEKMAQDLVRSEGSAMQRADSRRLLQSLRDLVSRAAPSSLAFLPAAADDSKLGGGGRNFFTSPAAAERRDDSDGGRAGGYTGGKGNKRVLLLAAADVLEFTVDLQGRLQSWGFTCCLAVPRTRGRETSEGRISATGDGAVGSHHGDSKTDLHDGDADAVAATCGAAVVVLSRPLLQCPRTRVLLSAVGEAGAVIFSVRAEGADSPGGWLSEACNPEHHIGASTFKEILRSLVSFDLVIV